MYLRSNKTLRLFSSVRSKHCVRSFRVGCHLRINTVGARLLHYAKAYKRVWHVWPRLMPVCVSRNLGLHTI